MDPLAAIIGLTLLVIIVIALIFINHRITKVLRTVRSVDEGVAEVIGMNTRAIPITNTGAQRAIRRSG